MLKGAKLSFTFNEGLVVQVLPGGDTYQKIVNEIPLPKEATKGNALTKDKPDDADSESYRVITTNGDIIKFMDDESFIIYSIDGSITTFDKRRGIWVTTNSKGIRRVRRTKDRIF